MTTAADGFQAVVLAGGLGTRLRSSIGDIPKPMAPVAGRPFLEILLERLAQGGVRDVVLSVGYRYQQIKDHFGDSYLGLRLTYAVETQPLGTGGGLRLALRHARRGAAFVLNGDTYAAVDLTAMHQFHVASASRLTMALCQVQDTGRYGSCLIWDQHVAALSAQGVGGPGYINAGVYLMSTDILERDELPEAFSFERDFLEARLDEIRPFAFPFAGQFIDIGVPADYERAQELFRKPLP